MSSICLRVPIGSELWGQTAYLGFRLVTIHIPLFLQTSGSSWVNGDSCLSSVHVDVGLSGNTADTWV
jgi:hypothetical protein